MIEAAALDRVGLRSAASMFVHLSKTLGEDDDAAQVGDRTDAAIGTPATAELH